jgi:site-specific DNA-methyltransferase (adenine-specific)
MSEDSKALLHNNDCQAVLPTFETASIHLVATDPPYFIDGMCDQWSSDDLRRRKANKSSQTSAVKGLPTSMGFDPRQGQNLQAFMGPVAEELFRVLKPGGFCIVFAQARLYHRLAISFEDVGFEIRDMGSWVHPGGQGKGAMQAHVVNRMSLSDEEKRRIIKSMDGRKTPQLRPKFEPFVVAQKPKDGTFARNWIKHNTGLVQLTFKEGQQTTIFEYNKPKNRKEIDHMTVKPVDLMERIIDVFSSPGQVVLDPFMGSGTTGIACSRKKRQFIGIERDSGHFKTAKGRIKRR